MAGRGTRRRGEGQTRPDAQMAGKARWKGAGGGRTTRCLTTPAGLGRPPVRPGKARRQRAGRSPPQRRRGRRFARRAAGARGERSAGRPAGPPALPRPASRQPASARRRGRPSGGRDGNHRRGRVTAFPPPLTLDLPEHVRHGAAAGGKDRSDASGCRGWQRAAPRSPRRGAVVRPRAVAAVDAARTVPSPSATTVDQPFGDGSRQRAPRTQDTPPAPAAAAAAAGRCAGRPPPLPRVFPAAPNTPRGCAPHCPITPHRDRRWVPERAGRGGGVGRGSDSAAVASCKWAKRGGGGQTGKWPVGRQATCGAGAGAGGADSLAVGQYLRGRSGRTGGLCQTHAAAGPRRPTQPPPGCRPGDSQARLPE